MNESQSFVFTTSPYPPYSIVIGTPERVRTSDLRLRRPLLYPAELQAHRHLSGRGERIRTSGPLLPRQVR
jgi:hypothetical protein